MTFAYDPSLVFLVNGSAGPSDLSGKENHGSYEGSMGVVTDANRLAFSFDGVNDFIKGPEEPLVGNAAFTASCWFKIQDQASGTGGLRKSLLQQGGGVTPHGGWRIAVDNGRLWVAVGDRVSRPVFTNTAVLDDGNWHFALVLFNPGGSTEIHIDGENPEIFNTSSISNMTPISGIPLAVGAYHDGEVTKNQPDQQYFDGLIDTVQIYNRTLLPEEISHLYRGRGYSLFEKTASKAIRGGSFAGPKNVTLNGGSFVRESSVRVLNNQGGSFGPTSPLAEEIADPFPGTIFSDGTLFDNGTFEYKAGTLNQATSSAVMDDLIKNPSREKEIYLTQDHENSTYVRNPNRILPQANLTGVSPWNSDLGNRKAGNAITPRHIHFATHYAIAVNATVRFVTLDNEVIERTLVSRQNVAGDLSIGTLDSDLPESILPSKVLPENWTEYFTESSEQFMALFVTDQEEKLLLKRPDLGSITVRDPVLSAYLSFNETLVGGDSGSPAFLIVENQPVAYTQMQTATTGTPLHQNLAEIEALVSQTGHQLQYLDLTRYENHAS